jgi:phosphotransferase system enzyme I (PtsP)
MRGKPSGEKGKDQRSHLNLLCDISELTDLLVSSLSVDNFLQKAVEMVAKYIGADVCSIYLYDESSIELYLAATTGLNPEAVGKIRLKGGEGIVGHCFLNLKPVCEGKAFQNPHFKYFKEAREERFKSFLVVPIHRGAVRIGAMVVQHERPDVFDETEILALRATSSQLASSIENARLLMEVRSSRNALPKARIPGIKNPIRAAVASGGFVYAPAEVYRKNTPVIMAEPLDEDSSLTMDDFRKAIEETADQLESLQMKFSRRLPESASLIFTTHFMMLKDESFVGKMEGLIEQGTPPVRAVSSISGHYISLFLASPHEYIREKANDVEDLTHRILLNLRRSRHPEDSPGRGHIIIAGQLYPSDILKLVTDDVQGIILAGGGTTTHIAILSRSLNIPLLIADQPELMNLPEGTPILLDAHVGNIYVRPSQKIVKQFRARAELYLATKSKARRMTFGTSTRDKVPLRLMANIHLLSEISVARDLKAEGIGLYRSEFPFLIRSAFPSENEQYPVYRRLFDEMQDLPVTIRTLDAGGEKYLAYMDVPAENNPEMGMRSIRFSLRHRDLFETQIRAVLRAAAGSVKPRIMFPMVSSVDEFLEARSLVNDCMRSLSRESLEYHDRPAIGAMVELPALVDIMDELADHADFFAVGTNDFVQYMLAADRSNKLVSGYYIPHHPSVLRGLHRIVQSAIRKNREISVCGEMAHELRHIPFLLGIGIRSLSVDPQHLPRLQAFIKRMRISDAEKYAGELLACSRISDVEKVMAEGTWQKLFPGRNS